MAEKKKKEAATEEVKEKKDKKPKASFADSNNTIFELTMQTGPTKELRLGLIENKKSGMVRMNIREWSHTDTYDGPTRNGLLVKIEGPETVDQWQKQLNAYFDKVRETL